MGEEEEQECIEGRIAGGTEGSHGVLTKSDGIWLLMAFAGRERKQVMRSLELVVEQPKLRPSLRANPRGFLTKALGL